MKTAVLILMSSIAFAKEPTEAKAFYTNAGGQKIETVDALMSAVKGETVYKCQNVETKISKSGNSIAIHTVKQPKKRQ